MNNKVRPDVIEILELEKKYHADQIRRINVAIVALTESVNIEKPTQQEQSPQKATKSTQWTVEIKAIFNSGDTFSIEQVGNKLIEKGIVEAMTNSGKNSIYATFSRLKKSGYLEKPGYGKYRKKQEQSIRRVRIDASPLDVVEDQ